MPRLTGDPIGDTAEPAAPAATPPPNSRLRSHWLPAARHAWLRPATCHRVAVRCAVRRARRHTCVTPATVSRRAHDKLVRVFRLSVRS